MKYDLSDMTNLIDMVVSTAIQGFDDINRIMSNDIPDSIRFYRACESKITEKLDSVISALKERTLLTDKVK